MFIEMIIVGATSGLLDVRFRASRRPMVLTVAHWGDRWRPYRLGPNAMSIICDTDRAPRSCRKVSLRFKRVPEHSGYARPTSHSGFDTGHRRPTFSTGRPPWMGLSQRLQFTASFARSTSMQMYDRRHTEQDRQDVQSQSVPFALK